MFFPRWGLVSVGFTVLVLLNPCASGRDIPAGDDGALRAALRTARPGDHIALGAGPFGGGFWSDAVAGEADKPIRISGAAPDHPAVFDSPDKTIFQFVKARYLEIDNIHIRRSGGHGLALDDGNGHDFSCNHIALRHCRIEDVKERGTFCAIKLAGVSDFTIEDCTFRNWGKSGDAVDGVGCRQGSVRRCTFLGGRGAVAVQFKGGSEDILIERCRFEDLNDMAINAGGDTDAELFRPLGRPFEARRITIAGNTFIGGVCAVAFANCDATVVRFNTIYHPRKWAFRILQDDRRPGMLPCGNGRVSDNIIVFDSRQWFEGGINIGPDTAPQTFTFAANAWFCTDRPARSAPRLPTPEAGAIIGTDPQFADPASGDLSLKPSSPLKDKGATATRMPGSE